MDKEILRIVADNKNLFEALRAHIESYFPLQLNESMSNELLGEQTRTYLAAHKGIERAFIDIARYKSVKDDETVQNPAR